MRLDVTSSQKKIKTKKEVSTDADDTTVATVADPTAFLERLFMAKLLDLKAMDRRKIHPTCN